MQLGRRLNPFNANMAPVVVPLHIRQSAVASTELPGANLPELRRTRTADRPIAQDVRVSRAQPHEATGAHQAEFAPLGENLTPGENLARPDAPRTPLPRAAAATVLPATQRMAMHAPNMPDPADAPVPTAIQASSSSSTLLSSDSANSVISHSMSPAMAPPIPPSILPSTRPSISPPISSSIWASSSPSTSLPISQDASATTQLSSQMANPSQIAAAHMTKIYGSDVTSQTDVRQIMMGAMAPRPPLGLTSNMPTAPIAAPTDGVSVVPSSATAPSVLIDDGFAKPDASQSSSASLEPQQANSEPRQGMLVLDGAQLGRWVIDHLESSASRPGAMTTGIDPRMNATYPGAPTSA